MKRLLLIFGFLLFIATYSQSVFAQSSGTFMVVKGEVQVKSKTGEVQKAKIGMKVTALDTITSGAEGRAKIVMSDQNVINISPDTIMTLEKYIYDPAKDDKQVTLNVLQGKVRATVEQKYDGEKNKFHVKTPSAVAGVRGTDFLTSYSPKTQEMKLVTFQGTVAVGVAGPGGSIANPVFVKPGESTTAMRGAPPAPPVPVPAKELSSMNTESSADTAGKPAPAAAATTTDEKDKDKDKDKNQDKEQEKEKDPAQKEEKKDEKKEDKKESQDKKENQDKAESKDKQESQDKKEPQEKKETQDKKEPQDKKETKEANKESGSSKEGGKQDQAKQESTSQKESAQKESGGAKEGGPSAKSESGSGSSKGGNKQEPSGSASNKEAGSSTTSNNASSGPKTEERGPASVQGQNPPPSNAKTGGPGQPPPPPPPGAGGGMMPPPPTMIDTRDLDVGGISNTVIQNNYAPPPAMINFTNPATRQDLTQPPKNEFMNSTIQQTQKATVNITIEKPK